MRCVLLLAFVFVFSVFLFSLEEIRSLKRVTCRRALSLSVFFSSDAQTKDNDREEKEEREENRERKRIHSTRSAISLSLSLFYFQRHVFAFEPNKNLERERKKETSHHRGDDADGGREKKIQKKSARARARVLYDANRVPAPNRLLRQSCLFLRPCFHSFCLSFCFFFVARAFFVWRNQKRVFFYEYE